MPLLCIIKKPWNYEVFLGLFIILTKHPVFMKYLLELAFSRFPRSDPREIVIYQQ